MWERQEIVTTQHPLQLDGFCNLHKYDSTGEGGASLLTQDDRPTNSNWRTTSLKWNPRAERFSRFVPVRWPLRVCGKLGVARVGGRCFQALWVAGHQHLMDRERVLALTCGTLDWWTRSPAGWGPRSPTLRPSLSPGTCRPLAQAWQQNTSPHVGTAPRPCSRCQRPPAEQTRLGQRVHVFLEVTQISYWGELAG